MSRFRSRFHQNYVAPPAPQYRGGWTDAWLRKRQLAADLAELRREMEAQRDAEAAPSLCLSFYKHRFIVCDLARGHKGKHVAHDLEGRIAAEWKS